MTAGKTSKRVRHPNCRIGRGHRPAEVARTLEAALQPDAPGAGAAEITETVALGEWLLALGRGGPTIVFLDDVQFAGVATLGALRRLVKDLDSGRLLLVLGLRRHTGTAQSVLLAEILERASARTERIDLGPVDETATLALVEEVFHHSVPRLRLARVLHERSDGIPGRIAEVLRLARERGWARPAAPPARGLELLVAPEDLPRPESLRVVLAARLAELSGRERVWLERAAVVGARIDPDLVARAWPRARAAQRDAALASLVRGGWLVTVGAQFRFARPVGREETLEAMRPRALLRAHGAVANALAEREDEQGKRPSYSRTFHLREAKRVDDLLRVLPGLVQRMRDGGHPHRRATLAGWGLEALDGLPLASQDRRLRRTLLEALADAADRLGEREEQRAALEALGELDIDLALEPHVAARIYVLHACYAASSSRVNGCDLLALL
jgi:hypothetical protein